MEKIINKNLIISILGSLLATFIWFSAPIVEATLSSIVTETSAAATSTVAFMSSGAATSSVTFQYTSEKTAINPNGTLLVDRQLSDVDGVSVFVEFVASTTASQLAVTAQFSNNGADWYGLSIPLSTTPTSATSTIAVATSTTYLWAPGVSATTTFAFNLPFIPARYGRLVFTPWFAGGAVYSEVNLKRNPHTP